MSTTKWTDFFIDSFAGAIAGVTMVLSSQPLDTIKVRMQMNPTNESMLKVLKDIYVREGLISYYKGVTAPLSTSLPVSLALFASYESYMRFFNINNRHEFILHHWLLAGGFAGLIQSFIVCPTELLKCVLQTQAEYLPKKYNSPIQCFKTFYRDDGLRGTFKGLMPTILRDIPQYAIFFTTFEICKYLCLKQRESQKMTFFESLIAGALAGLTSISASYPQDLIKTKIQCEVTRPQKTRIYTPTYYDGGTTQCAQLIFKTGGYKGFWAGFNSASAFYIVSCSVQLLTYEQTKILLNIIYPNKH